MESVWRAIVLVAGVFAIAFGFAGCAGDGGSEAGVDQFPVSADPVSVGRRSAPIGRGDTLEMFVREDPTFDGEYLVRERGEIIIPEVGRIYVAGLSVEDVERKIKESLERRQLTSASVMVDRISSGSTTGTEEEANLTMIYLSGKVNRPGRHGVPLYQGRAPTIYESILICGGLARFADETKITLLRPEGGSGEKRRYSVNLKKIKEGEAEDFAIAEGDILIVPEKTFSL